MVFLLCFYIFFQNVHYLCSWGEEGANKVRFALKALFCWPIAPVSIKRKKATCWVPLQVFLELLSRCLIHNLNEFTLSPSSFRKGLCFISTMIDLKLYWLQETFISPEFILLSSRIFMWGYPSSMWSWWQTTRLHSPQPIPGQSSW